MKNPKNKQEIKQNKSYKDLNKNKNIIDETPKRNFIIVYDSVYKNNNLNALELQLIIKLLSCAPTFKPSYRKLTQILKISDTTLLKAVKGLKEKGYLTIVKNGKESEWHITQEPTINKIKDLNCDTLVNALLDFEITPKELKQLHKLKYIDDIIYIKTLKKYSEEIQKIIKSTKNYYDN